jgi:hypothetical protein
VPQFVDVDMGINRWIYDDRIGRFLRNDLEDLLPPIHYAVCHPHRRYHARGMCGTCYRLWNRWLNHRRAHPPQALVERGICLNGRDRNEQLDRSTEETKC